MTNLSPAQKKVIERLGDGAVLCKQSIRAWWPATVKNVRWESIAKMLNLQLIQSGREPGDFYDTITLTPKGQQLYEDMKKK